jgi:lipopolysaccharide export system protein LptA
MTALTSHFWRRRLLAAAILTIAAIGGLDAAAQQPPPQQPQKNQGPPNALQGFSQNRDQPVKIQAASLEVREKDKMATFSGDVHVFNGDTEMRCKSLIVFYEEDPKQPGMKAAEPGPGGERSIKRIEAKGGVNVVQKEQNAFGESATFNMRENVVTLTGNVVVTSGKDILRGQRLVVDLTSGVSKMDQGRVEGLFSSGSRNPPGTPPGNTPEKK